MYFISKKKKKHMKQNGGCHELDWWEKAEVSLEAIVLGLWGDWDRGRRQEKELST